MRVSTYEEAVQLGIGDVWLKEMAGTDAKPSGLKSRKAAKSSPVVVPPAKTQAVDDGFNKLERSFWDRLVRARDDGKFEQVWHHAMKFVVIGECRWYTPDFVARTPHAEHPFTIFETKGFMREDASLKLIAAASEYPCFLWVLVKREKRAWHCCHVTSKGFSREYFTPNWLI